MKRFFSVFLCFVLLLSFAVSPIRVKALAPDPFTAAFWAVEGIAIDFATEGAEFIASAISSSLPKIKLTPVFFKNVIKVSNLVNFLGPGLKVPFHDFNSATQSAGSTNTTVTIPEATYDDIADAVGQAQSEGLLESDGNDWTAIKSALKGMLDTTIFAPPDSIWSNAQNLTHSRLMYDGFLDVAELNNHMETLNKNVLAGNSISWQIFQKLMQLSGYLRTDFLDFFADQFESLGTRLENTFRSIEVAAPNVYVDLQSVADAIASLETAIGKMQDKLAGLLTTINSTLGDLEDTLSDDLGTLNESIKTLNANMNTWDRTLIDRVLENLQQIKKYQVDGSSSVVENLQQVKKNQVLIYDRLYEVVTNVNTNITSLKTNLVYRLQLLETAINNLIKKVENIAATLTDYVDVTVKDTILVPKPEVTVAVGQQQILVSDYATAQTAFSLKLGWVTDLFDFLRELFNRIVYAEEPPKVMLNLSKAEGSYNIGTDTVMIDLSWYEKYKAIGDLLLSGILWIAFCMHAYRRTPDILSGVGATVRSSGRGSDQ